MSDQATRRKELGAYYTPEPVVQSLVRWVVRKPSDRLIDPACGDGRFLGIHANSVGVEQDPEASAVVHERSPGSLIHEGDFFTWATDTQERFDCAVGNPPFIRYQRFTGNVRKAARELCAKHGARFSGLSSSWAPFLVATASLLRPGGRMAFVVPAEIGHAPYAKPVLEYMVGHFDLVKVIAIQRKVFPELSEDCWLLYCEGYGDETNAIQLSPMTYFGLMNTPPSLSVNVAVRKWQAWNHRLRPFLLSRNVRNLYESLACADGAMRLGDVAQVGIGYVTGANDFFHLRPSEARKRSVPSRFLWPAVRSAKALKGRAVNKSTVDKWRRRDEPILLLRLGRNEELPSSVRTYLDSDEGREARNRYKCRMREPWYAVPDVTVPDAFLAYMSGDNAALVANRARCVGTNSVHVVTLKNSISITRLQRLWRGPLTQLSCEIEGHPLGGGMLKVEPGEAGRIVLLDPETLPKREVRLVKQGIQEMRRWRHYG